MAEASFQMENPPIYLVEETILSKDSLSVLHEPCSTSGKKVCSSQRKLEQVPRGSRIPLVGAFS